MLSSSAKARKAMDSVLAQGRSGSHALRRILIQETEPHETLRAARCSPASRVRARPRWCWTSEGAGVIKLYNDELSGNCYSCASSWASSACRMRGFRSISIPGASTERSLPAHQSLRAAAGDRRRRLRAARRAGHPGLPREPLRRERALVSGRAGAARTRRALARGGRGHYAQRLGGAGCTMPSATRSTSTPAAPPRTGSSPTSRTTWRTPRSRPRVAGGNAPTIADLACFPYIALAPEGGIALDRYPALRRWIAA